MGLLYDDLKIGEVFSTGGRTIFEADVINFCAVSGIQEELYTNSEFAKRESIFGRAFVPGPLTFVFAEGLVIRRGLFHGTALVLLEVGMTFVSPVFVGDTITVRVEVAGKRETSDPARGIVNFVHYVEKTSGERVMNITKTRMFRTNLDGDAAHE